MNQLCTFRIFIVLSSLFSTTLGARAWAGDSEAEEAAAIIKLVQEAQRAAALRHDQAKAEAIWAADAKLIGARTEKPDECDTVMTRSQSEALARLISPGAPPEGLTFEFTNERVQISGNRAVLRYRGTRESKDVLRVSDEIFRLRKIDGRWEVYENRFWPVETRFGEKTTKYNAKTWKALDAEVDRKRQQKDLFGEAFSLMHAWRFKEGHATAKKVTEQSGDDALNWILRGHAAVAAADAADALTSFSRALQIDEKADVPDYIRARRQK